MEFDRMKRAQIEESASLSARAFFDYHYFSDYVTDEKRRASFLQKMMAVEMKLNFDLMDIFVASQAGKITAVAMLCPPEYRKPSDWEYIRGGFGGVYLAGGIKNVSDWCALERKASAPCHGVKNSWYLSLLTVDPQSQGSGIGTAMLQERLMPYIRSKGGKTLTLFTNSEENRVFYKNNGFEEFDEQCFTYLGRELGSWSYKREI